MKAKKNFVDFFKINLNVEMWFETFCKVDIFIEARPILLVNWTDNFDWSI